MNNGFKMSLLFGSKYAQVKMWFTMTRVQVFCRLIIITSELATSRFTHWWALKRRRTISKWTYKIEFNWDIFNYIFSNIIYSNPWNTFEKRLRLNSIQLEKKNYILQKVYLFIFLDMINVPRQISHVQIKLLTQIEANFDATILCMSRTLGRIVPKVKIVKLFKTVFRMITFKLLKI